MSLTHGSKQTRQAKGPRRDVHIRIAYTGHGPPGPILLGRRDELENRLEAEQAGLVLRSGAKGGSVDICVVTADPDRTKEIAWKHINDLGLASRTTIRAEDAPRSRL